MMVMVVMMIMVVFVMVLGDHTISFSPEEFNGRSPQVSRGTTRERTIVLLSRGRQFSTAFDSFPLNEH